MVHNSDKIGKFWFHPINFCGLSLKLAITYICAFLIDWKLNICPMKNDLDCALFIVFWIEHDNRAI